MTGREDLRTLEENLLAWADECGQMARGHFRRTGGLRFKHGREAVTEADLAIEEMLRRKIAAAYPDDCVVGEEMGGDGSAATGRVWQIDPIDGTLNFALGLPGFCTSLAVLEGEEIIAACVHQPLVGDFYSAVAGGGARLNGEPMRVSGRAILAEAIVSTQFKKGGRFVQQPALLREFALRTLKCRREGAIALELSWVASGGFDALVGDFGEGIHLWDVAAGLLLIQEAGGRITDQNGQPYRPGGPIWL
jgi:myo-inositol-1(or 4)-monophosphatase